jgi:nucleoid-associated protein YgaU
MNDPIENPSKLSLYRFENFFKVYQDSDSGNLYYNLLKNISIFPADDESVEDTYTVKHGDTWVYISHKQYNTMDLWWLVIEYNDIKNPTQFPEVGTTLKLLKSGYVYSVISELNRQFNN